MSSLTLEFENARSVHALHGGDEKLFREVEIRLNVKIVSRDSWLRIEGPDDAVSKAKLVFDQLLSACRTGIPIRKHEFRYALEAASQGLNGLNDLLSLRLPLSPKKPPVIPKTKGQRDYLRAISNHDITFGIGPAGTGKTFLAVAMAVSALKQDAISRIILTRPAVEAGEALGFLPGDLQEKILPYLRPLYDALHDMLETEEVQKMMDRGTLEIAPLAYMRGRTLARSFVILDEAQNTTTEQMFMFLTRLGNGSKCVITGDHTQIDLPKNKSSGLIEAIQALRNVPGIAFQYLLESDVVRHPLVQSIISAYHQHRAGIPSRI